MKAGIDTKQKLLNFNDRKWLLMVKRKSKERLWTFNGISFANKKEISKIISELNDMLMNYKNSLNESRNYEKQNN